MLVWTPGNQTCFSSGVGFPSLSNLALRSFGMYQRVGRNALRRSSRARA